MGESGKERESFRKRSSTFSLNFPVIRFAVSGEARGKVHPHGKSFASRLKSRSFDKLQEVGVFLLRRRNRCLRTIQMVGTFGAEMVVYFNPKDFGLSAKNSGLF